MASPDGRSEGAGEGGRLSGAWSRALGFLGDPKTIIAGVLLGVLCGLFARDLAFELRPLAAIYIALLSMCMLPIMVTALTWGIGQMLRNPVTRPLFGRLAGYYAVGLLLPSVVGLLAVYLLQPGAGLSEEATNALGARVEGHRAAAVPEPSGSGLLTRWIYHEEVETGGVLGFLQGVVPSNVFSALSSGQFISIVFFSVLIGLALGVVRSTGADETLRVVNTFYEIFAKVFGWVLVPLPLGLFAIVAAAVVEIDTEMFAAFARFLLTLWVAGLALILVYAVITAVAARCSPLFVLDAQKQPLILALATDNPFVALYSSIEALRERFGVRRELSDTVAPFGVVANQHGQILLFAVLVGFLAQLYDVQLGPGELVVLTIGCVVGGAAAVGGGAILAPVVAPVLLGAGIPPVLAVVVLATTQPLTAPLGSMLTVKATNMLAVLTAAGEGKRKP
ncbi:MAG: cation:dicarboxylase symporter family transporter [Kiloniellales bacterium]|nr:cation:dicarboxylase symporter family transporter [Kiloniellales bacterium]